MNTAEHTANIDKFFADALEHEASEFFALNPEATVYTFPS